MSEDNRAGLLDWLALERRPDLSKARWLGAGVTVLGGLTVALLFGMAVFVAFTKLTGALFGGLLE